MNSKQIRKIVKVAFPNYRGLKLYHREVKDTISVRSYWDGGYKTNYALVNLETMRLVRFMPDSHPFLNTVDFDADAFEIPQGHVMIANRVGGTTSQTMTVIIPI